MAVHLMRPLKRETYPVGAEEYAPEILAAWLANFPDSKPSERDKEDWVENAIFLEVFSRLGVDYTILDPSPAAAISSSKDGVLEGEGHDAFFHSGISRSDQIKTIGHALPLQNSAAIRNVMKYASSQTFRRHAGREMIFVAPEGSAVSKAVREIVPDSGHIFLKTIKKEYARVFAIDATRDPWQQICEQDEDLPWMIMHYDGMEEPYFSVQGVIAPTYEYRMFMVGDTPVTGAGCVEHFTPLDNEMLFDAKMEMIRNESDVENEREIADRYLAFAVQFGKEFAAEFGPNHAYSLDLCIDAQTGKVVPIELNPPFNLGRYASRVDVWVKAVDILLKEKD